jgi:hypothetical protein
MSPADAVTCLSEQWHRRRSDWQLLFEKNRDVRYLPRKLRSHWVVLGGPLARFRCRNLTSFVKRIDGYQAPDTFPNHQSPALACNELILHPGGHECGPLSDAIAIGHGWNVSGAQPR